MDSDVSSPTQENNEPKAEFRKLTNEAANRKYRRRSPVGGSSDEDGSPKRDRSSRKVSDYERRTDDRVDDRSFSRGHHGRSSDSYRNSSRGHHSRYDDHSRYGKHADEDNRSHAKSSSSRSGREYRDRESDYDRSRDRYRDVDRYARDRSDAADRKYRDKDFSSDRAGHDGRHGSRYDDRDRNVRDRDERDEKRDYRSSRDHKNDRTASYEDSRGHRSDSTSKRAAGDQKDLDGSKYSQDGKNKNNVLDRDEAGHAGAGRRSEDRSAFVSEDLAAKRPKFSDVRKADERQTSVSKQDDELVAKSTPDQSPFKGSDSGTSVDAAKVAAMKAAELVNQNLVGTGFMTADQKKKLLWGNKKSNNTEESSHRWDSTLFSDRERQEKFNKLMGVKGDVKVDSRTPSSQDAEKQKELQLDLEKQYTAGLRRRDGRTVGLGL